MARPRQRPSPFRYFNSSPKIIRLVVMMYVKFSHLPFRRRERAMNRFRRMKTLQKFVSVHASIHNHFSQERYLVCREIYRETRSAALAEWRAVMN